MKPWMGRLQKMARVVAQEKPTLHFMGLVPQPGLPDRWDLLVCSDQLEERGMEALRYIAGLLKKYMSAKDRVKVSTMIIMPNDKAWIKKLEEPGEFKAERLHSLYRFDAPDQVVVIWPAKSALQWLRQRNGWDGWGFILRLSRDRACNPTGSRFFDDIDRTLSTFFP